MGLRILRKTPEPGSLRPGWDKVLKFRRLLPIGRPAAAVFMEPGINHEQDKDNDADDDKEEDTWAGVP